MFIIFVAFEEYKILSKTNIVESIKGEMSGNLEDLLVAVGMGNCMLFTHNSFLLLSGIYNTDPVLYISTVSTVHSTSVQMINYRSVIYLPVMKNKVSL